MTPELRAFLTATDLDELLAAREAIKNIDAENNEAITLKLEKWASPQEVANLLMYPELMPKKIRLACIIKGLDEPQTSYFVLAAIIGLQRIDIDGITEVEQAQIVDRLIAIIVENKGVLAERASIFLADKLLYFKKNHAASIVTLLNHPSELVRHNILVALIPLVGLENMRKFLDTAVTSNGLSETGREFAEDKMVGIEGLSDNNTVDMARFDLGDLNTSWLSYIPNLNEWPSSRDLN